MSVLISGVEKGSAAEKSGVKPGQILHAVNGNKIDDVLDYRFYITEKNPVLLLSGEDKICHEIRLRKAEYSDPGLIFDSYLMDNEKCCKNKCVFCFIDQLPKGMRESLYFKDDDSRLGFLFGNYITLTNLDDNDIDRIIKMRVSPVNISVHTMNPSLRTEMMRNPRAGETLSYISKLCEAGINVNIQLVLCPGINDGIELERSLNELSSFGENLQSVSAVPVGLTKFREGLPELKLFTADEAKRAIKNIQEFGDRMLEQLGSRVFFASDELYLTAGLPMPDYEHYEDFPQLENGVGMSALLEQEFTEALADVPVSELNRRVTIATGVAAYPLLKRLTQNVESKFPGLSVNVIPVKNHFFGETITVSGLITGYDLAEQLSGIELGECVLFPATMLRFERDLFLDGMSPSELEKSLGIPVIPVENNGYDLLDALIGASFERKV